MWGGGGRISFRLLGSDNENVVFGKDMQSLLCENPKCKNREFVESVTQGVRFAPPVRETLTD